MMQLLALFVLLALVVLAPAAAGPAHASDTVSASTHVGDKVNINTADVKELMTLTGVGHNLAEKIVKFRDEHGQFKRPHDLRKVDGVGEALWEKNRERIVVK